jgi:omega-6 fatty acid desaturase (delta-12 desaturase)
MLTPLGCPARPLSRPQIPRAPSAAAIDAPAVPISQLSLEERQKLAEQWGYKSIGAELPDGVTLTDIVKSMPQEVRQSWVVLM